MDVRDNIPAYGTLTQMNSGDSLDRTDSLQALAQRVVAFRDERDWSQFHGLKDEALSLVAEVGELAELFRWHEGEKLQAHVAEHREEIGDELADVLYWTLLIAHDAGVDLAEAFLAKMEKNEAKYPVHLARGSARKYDELEDDGAS